MNDALVAGLLASAKWINGLLVFGLALAGTIVLLKLSGKTEFEVFKVKFSTDAAWAVFGLLTLAHVYTAYVFVTDAYELFFLPGIDLPLVWQKLRSADLLFFHRLIARVEPVMIAGPRGVPIRLYKMSFSDPTTWLAHGSAILLFMAVIRMRAASWIRRLATSVAAGLIVVVNWYIGGHWVVAASELSLNPTTSWYFANLREILGRQ